MEFGTIYVFGARVVTRVNHNLCTFFCITLVKCQIDVIYLRFFKVFIRAKYYQGLGKATERFL